ncbi:eukaryotic translation initiation factor 2A [Hylaeus anthracinus]|uniref:eukaryotic translation initiation factor 2A n=1 Tax=Hylaeus anthracinus TaxID=313031 RepID=UPI0023B8CF8F|nr:eukaryotic translation initiation factor 2A [Hylaeus anthracinus]
MALPVPCVAVRGTIGVSLGQGPPSYEAVKSFPKDDSKTCKAMAFSPEGRFFAWINGMSAKVLHCDTWKVAAEIKRPKISAIHFSTQGTYFMTWEPFIATQANPQGSPNLHIWKSESGELVKSFIQKKQIDWQPQWSSNEKLCGMLVGADVILYEDVDFSKATHKINVAKVANFSISPNNTSYYILCYMPGKSGQPSFGRLFQYPKFESTQALANKSFFQADKVNIYWNNLGTNALLMTSTEVDKASYYGKQTLHYLSTKGETALVMLNKEGPIHAVEWSPKNTEFCVLYGFMPAKATLFNLKCESVFEFGALHRNSIYYNPQGNILILTGFGNLSGGIELWDVGKRKLIAKTEAPDTTLLQWSPDGKHFMTATTAPRLRMSNGFKIWHYTGTLLYERPWNEQEELWEVLWQPFPPNTFPEKAISYKAVEGIASSQPQASKQAYRPPFVRGRESISFKLCDDDELGIKKTTDAKGTAKTKKKTKKVKKESEASASSQTHSTSNTNGQVPTTTRSQNLTAANVTECDDLERSKKIKRIKAKLEQISKLKEQLRAGKSLEINQLDKIKKEADLLKEVEELTL